MPDNNDILFNEYSLDFFAFIDYVFAFLFGGEEQATVVQVEEWFRIGHQARCSLGFLMRGMFLLYCLGFASFLLIFGIIYAYIKHNQLGEVFAEILKRQEEAFAKIHKKDVKNLRWQDVLVHSDSERPNDWKLAIIEADIILDELLNTLGYAGTTIGEKLKSASPTSFTTINQAWRAHNVRNKIAHEGADFNLSQKEARQTVAEYKMVFDEFNFI